MTQRNGNNSRTQKVLLQYAIDPNASKMGAPARRGSAHAETDPHLNTLKVTVNIKFHLTLF